MSIILDALKKAESDRAKKPGASPEFSKPPVVVAPPQKADISVLPLVLVACGIGVLLAAAFLGYRMYAQKKGGSSPAIGAVSGPSVKGAQDSESLKQEALAFYDQADWEKGRLKLEEASRLNPQDPEIHNNLGLVLKKMGATGPARQAYERALSLKNDYAEAANNLGVLELAAGFLPQARSLFEKAAKLRGNYAEPRFHLALVDEREGKKTDALRHYEEGLAASPDLDPKIRGQITMRILILKSE